MIALLLVLAIVAVAAVAAQFAAHDERERTRDRHPVTAAQRRLLDEIRGHE